MAKYYETSTTFNFNWDQVVQGFWCRYPNPHSHHVLTEDTLERNVRNGKLYTKRLLSKTNRVPKWAEHIFNAKSVKIIEESVCDPDQKTLTTYTRNVAFTKVMSVIEKVVYKCDDAQPGKTIAVRSAWIDSQMFGFSRAIRAFGVERFKKNCHKMVAGFNIVLDAMFPATEAAIEHLQQQQQQQYPSILQLHPSLQQLHATKTMTLKEAAKKRSEQVKAQAEQIYQSYSVKNWFFQFEYAKSILFFVFWNCMKIFVESAKTYKEYMYILSSNDRL